MQWLEPSTWCDLGNLKNCIPFVALSAAQSGEKIDRPIFTRITEWVITGAIAGGIGAYSTLIVLESKVDGLQSSMNSFMEQVEKERQDLRSDIRRLEGFHMKGADK